MSPARRPQSDFLIVYLYYAAGYIVFLNHYQTKSEGVMESKGKIKLFEQKQIRREWDEGAEKWWFSVLDVISILTEQSDYAKVRNYWKWLKNKLKEEGSELVSNTNQLKLEAADGKKYLADVAPPV